MVADRRRRTKTEPANEQAAHHPARASSSGRSTASDPARSAWVAANAGSGKTHVLAQRVIRLLLVRRRSGAHPLHHLHQGRRRQHGEPRVRRAAGSGPCSTTPRSTTAMRKTGVDADRRQAARAGAAAVRAGAGDAGRAEGADHPRLLHAAPASVPVRGQCRGALRGARRDQRERSCSNRLSLDVMLEAAATAGQPARPRAGPGGRSPQPTSPSATWCARRSASATS